MTDDCASLNFYGYATEKEAINKPYKLTASNIEIYEKFRNCWLYNQHKLKHGYYYFTNEEYTYTMFCVGNKCPYSLWSTGCKNQAQHYFNFTA
jgi:hypothetical protein